MALACNAEGLAKVRASAPYKQFLRIFHKDGKKIKDQENDRLEPKAIAYAVRMLHATAALDLSTHPIPGTELYLIESYESRESWGRDARTIAASHHWTLEKVESELGRQEMAPLAKGKGDLAYVACLLRLIDYAHISRERASTIERAFRQPIEADSLVHWLAQERIAGPERVGDELVYRSLRPIEDVDAWWLYYGMLHGLNSEIMAVRRYLEGRKISESRLSLKGVRGALSPEQAAIFIRTAGFEPVEVNLKTDSIARVVQILCGESLYGKEPTVAVRELVQNAHDAMRLRQVTVQTEAQRLPLSLPIRVTLNTKTKTLEVSDSGVGMSQNVMTNYLLSIASDYWNSEQFATDFPSAIGGTFRPAGKFGIGFLSVFMLGDEVEVESSRDGRDQLYLKLRGIGRRGEFRTFRRPGTGTSVRVKLRDEVVDRIRNLPELIKARCPMLDYTLEVKVDEASTKIETHWWKIANPTDLVAWVSSRRLVDVGGGLYYQRYVEDEKGNLAELSRWMKGVPEWNTDKCRLIASPNHDHSILCLKGIALTEIRTPGFSGIFNSEEVTPDTSRRRALDFDIEELLKEARSAVRDSVIRNLDALSNEGFVTTKIDFITRCVECYGGETILRSRLPWISTVTLPGEVMLVSCDTFVERLRSAARLVLSYKADIWETMSHLSSLDPQFNEKEVAVALPSIRGLYLRGFTHERKVGLLEELLPGAMDSSLFSVIFSLVASTWKTTLTDLLKLKVWEQESTHLVGVLNKNALRN